MSDLPHFRRFLRRFPVPLSLLLWACGDSGPESENELRVALSTGVPDLTIGTLDGADAYVFGRVGGLTADDEGRIYVVDAQSSEIRVFDSDGGFLYSLGGRGGGPGELAGPCCLAWDEDGVLWVRDADNLRYNGYRPAGESAEYAGTVRMAHNSGGFWNPLTFDAAGNLVDVGGRVTEALGLLDVVRIHLGRDGEVVREEIISPPPRDSVGMALIEDRTSDGVRVSIFYQPFGPQHLISHAPGGGWAEVINSRYSVIWNGPDSSFRHVLEGEATGPLVTEEERTTGEERLRERTQARGVDIRDIPFEVPERKPPIRALHFSQEGELWVEIYTDGGEPRRAHVYDATGAQLFTAEWPREVDLSLGYVGEGFALGVSRDELDVERVVRVRFELESLD